MNHLIGQEHLSAPNPAPAGSSLSRRAALKAGAALLAGLAISKASAATNRTKKVIVAGGGVAGLSCAYELMEMGHDVTLLEASRRTGGHVKTIRAPLPDGLYADVGAENFPRPGYDHFWNYVEKFGLTALPWHRRKNQHRRIGGRWYSEAEMSDPSVLQTFGFNSREVDYIVKNGLSEISLLYFDSYLARFKDEYQPFGLGLDHLDHVLAADVMAKEGASDAAIRFSGQGRRSSAANPPTSNDASALYRIWISAILKMRGLTLQPREIFRLQGGNQVLTDAFTARLGDRVRRNCAVTSIDHRSSSVRVRFDEAGTKQEMTADYLVVGMSPLSLSAVTVTPAWPEAKAYALSHTRLGMHSRVLLQTKTPFWKGDVPSINLLTGDPLMGSVCETAEDVPGERRLLFGTGKPVQTPEQTLAAFRGFYPGKAKDTIEQVIVHQWWKEEPTCVGCEREPFPLGQFARIWPHLIEPVGRIHFAGAAYDNHWRGVEAATRSANRAARAIDAA